MSSRVLLITSDSGAASALRQVLANASEGGFAVEWAKTLSEGLGRLAAGRTDVVLTELNLPDAEELEAFEKIVQTAPDLPLITLSSSTRMDLVSESIRRGALGYLCREHFGSSLVPQILHGAIARKSIEREVFREKERIATMLSCIDYGVVCIDADRRIVDLNAVAERMAGWNAAQARGHKFEEVLRIVDSTTREPARCPIEMAMQGNVVTRLSADSLLLGQSGAEIAIEHCAAPLHDMRGNVTGAILVFQDVSITRSMAQKMAHQAQHDFLTDLPNRVLLNDRISQAIELAKRGGTQLAFLFLDLDNFKHINDSLGHAIGDQLLQSVARRLVACVRSSDTVSRQGGDEFVILLAEDKHAEDAAITAEKIINAMTVPHRISGHELFITTSIGISIFPMDGADADALIRNADTAMYLAKKMGRNNYQFFKSEMNARAVERQLIEGHLRHALERKELILHYQPKINLRTGAITGAEALLRWQHPVRGLMLPSEFVSIAEECGLLIPIGRWVLRQACLQAKRWSEEMPSPVSVAVNISASEFRSISFYHDVRTILQETGLAPSLLELELTETSLLWNTESSAELLRALKSLGVQLAIDDFGTGYSSLSYLKQFPIDSLKIDQSFVRDVALSSNDGIIVNAVIGMGRNLHQRVVAEGVEKHGQYAFLSTHHCEEGQGYYFSRPLLPDQFGKLLETGIARELIN